MIRNEKQRAMRRNAPRAVRGDPEVMAIERSKQCASCRKPIEVHPEFVVAVARVAVLRARNPFELQARE